MLENMSKQQSHRSRILHDIIEVGAKTEPNELVERGQRLVGIQDCTSEWLQELTAPARSVVMEAIAPTSKVEGSLPFGLGRLVEVLHAID